MHPRWSRCSGLLALAVAVFAALVLAAPGFAGQFEFLDGRPVDAPTAALIEHITRQAGAVTGASVAGPAAPGPDAASGPAAGAGAPPERTEVPGQANDPAPVAGSGPASVAGPSAGPGTPLAGAVEAPGSTAGLSRQPPPASPTAGVFGLPDPGILRQAAAALAVQAAPDTARAAMQSADQRTLVLFVSWSMGAAALRDTLQEALADGHTRVVIRGVLPGERMGDAVRRLAPLLAASRPRGTLDFDPPAFRKAAVAAVPTIWDPGTGSQWRGSVALAAFRGRLAGTVATFSESVGPAAPVAEPDLEEDLKARAAGIDFAALRAQAYQRYWQRVALVSLPAAGIAASRVVDPAVWLSAPLRDAAGQVVVPAGTRINTLETHPWSRQLVIFDASDPRQMAWATVQAKQAEPAIFLTSGMDRQAAWEGWSAAVAALGQPLFLLDAELARRMDVRAVPSVVWQEGTLLRVREIGPADLAADPAAVR